MNITKAQIRISGAAALILALFLTLSFSCFAGEILWDSYEVPDTRQKERVLDNADLLSDSEEAEILSRLDSISQKWKCDVVLLTVDDHNGPIQDYADDYFDYNGFGSEFNGSGILFMLSMYDREWAFSTQGDGAAAFTDYGQEYMFNEMRGYLGDNDYYSAFSTYASLSDKLLEMYAQGTPYDVGTKQPKTASDVLMTVIISILGGCGIALIPILKMKSDLKTVKMAPGASNYQSEKGVALTTRQDRFIRKTLNKTPIPKDNGSSRSGGGGGSTMHTSSSGHSHGGSHGHF